MTKHLILGSVILLACVLPSPSFADVEVTVDGNNYDVSTLATTYDTSASLLQSEPWWGNGPLAQSFATAVGQSLGTSSQNGYVVAGPLFNYQGGEANLLAYASENNATTPLDFISGTIGTQPFTFAVATDLTPVPESSANPAWLAAAGLFVVWRGWRTFRPVTA